MFAQATEAAKPGLLLTNVAQNPAGVVSMSGCCDLSTTDERKQGLPQKRLSSSRDKRVASWSSKSTFAR
jgi:hypothetical protein